jgi:predicted ArsR family transcriptional regulator
MPIITRNKIAEFISRQGKASAREISQHLNLTREDIQYHLKIMLSEGTIEYQLRQAAPAEEKKGRPEKFYILSLHRPQNIYDRLLLAVLGLFLETEENQKQGDHNLKATAEILHPSPQRKVSPTKMLSQTIRLLAQDGYRPSWEASKKGPRVYFNSCPFGQNLLEKCPYLCQLDIHLLENLTGTSVQLIEKYTESKRMNPRCAFQLISPQGIFPDAPNQ